MLPGRAAPQYPRLWEKVTAPTRAGAPRTVCDRRRCRRQNVHPSERGSRSGHIGPLPHRNPSTACTKIRHRPGRGPRDRIHADRALRLRGQAPRTPSPCSKTGRIWPAAPPTRRPAFQACAYWRRVARPGAIPREIRGCARIPTTRYFSDYARSGGRPGLTWFFYSAAQGLQLRFQQRQTGTTRSELHCRLSVPLCR